MIWPLSPKGTFDRALRATKGLKPGSWEAVEALAQLALSAHEGGRPEASALLKDAQRTAGGLKRRGRGRACAPWRCSTGASARSGANRRRDPVGPCAADPTRVTS